MDTFIDFRILPQPDNTTCGPTCLHAVYSYYKDPLPIEQVISEVTALEGGGTLAVWLACHALRRGYKATIYTYNLQMFDPTWFQKPDTDIRKCLSEQMKKKDDAKLHAVSRAYLEFFDLGGKLRYEDLRTSLIRRYLKRSIPILTGLSSTYLYRSAREYGPKCEEDDIRGEPAGHFVGLCGYDKKKREVLVADPLRPNPIAETYRYWIHIYRVVGAILLGIVTHDANLLVIEPKRTSRARRHALSDHRQQP